METFLSLLLTIPVGFMIYRLFAGLTLDRPTRYPVEGVLECRLRFDKEDWDVTPLNLSVGGVGLLVGRPLHPGELLTLDLINRDRNHVLTVQARVVWCQQNEEGFRAGCQFRVPLGEELVQWLSSNGHRARAEDVLAVAD